MKNRIFILALLGSFSYSFAQVGINKNDPKATLDVVGSPTDTSAKDGIIAPRITGDQLRALWNGSDRSYRICYCSRLSSCWKNSKCYSCGLLLF